MNDRMRDETIEQAADRAAAAGDFAGARTMLEHAVEADGSSHGLWMKLSAMRKASGDLKGALAAIDCEVEDVVERHSHAIVIGRVLDIQASTRGAALAYWQGQYVAIDQNEDAIKLAEVSLPAARPCRKW